MTGTGGQEGRERRGTQHASKMEKGIRIEVKGNLTRRQTDLDTPRVEQCTVEFGAGDAFGKGGSVFQFLKFVNIPVTNSTTEWKTRCSFEPCMRQGFVRPWCSCTTFDLQYSICFAAV